jgi:hypothetical protein
MLSQARRFVIFALAASLLALTVAMSASAQEPDRDGDGYPDSTDQCPDQPTNGYPGGQYGCPGENNSVPYDPYGPGGDFAPDGDRDRDGVLNGQDRCPDAGASGGVTKDGCPDRDRDGWADDRDGCPDDAANQYSSSWDYGCPGRAPFAEKDTPPASGPSCTEKRPCIVLKRKGLSEKQTGGYIDPDATVKVTIARDANGMPARVVGAQLRNVNSSCLHRDKTTGKYSTTPGPEVSVNLDPLALKQRIARHANFNSTVFQFDPFSPVRTINGLKYKLVFYMEKDDGAREAELSINVADMYEGRCSINMYGNNDPVKRTTTAEEKKAVAECKQMPTGTKKQRRKRANCLQNARY